MFPLPVVILSFTAAMYYTEAASVNIFSSKELVRVRRQFGTQDSSLQQTLQGLQNTQQQQSQGRPGQSGNNQGQPFGNNQGTSGGFNQGGFMNVQGQGTGGFNQGGFSNGGQGTNQAGSGTNQIQIPNTMTTVRTPLNVVTNENSLDPAIRECIRTRCPSTNQYNPVCGDDNITYTNAQKLRCAQQCNRQVQQVYNGSCVTTPSPNRK